MSRKKVKGSMYAKNAGELNKTVNDIRSESMSKEQMKKDWGSPKSTMNRKIAK